MPLVTESLAHGFSFGMGDRLATIAVKNPHPFFLAQGSAGTNGPKDNLLALAFEFQRIAGGEM